MKRSVFNATMKCIERLADSRDYSIYATTKSGETNEGVPWPEDPHRDSDLLIITLQDGKHVFSDIADITAIKGPYPVRKNPIPPLKNYDHD